MHHALLSNAVGPASSSMLAASKRMQAHLDPQWNIAPWRMCGVLLTGAHLPAELNIGNSFGDLTGHEILSDKVIRG